MKSFYVRSGRVSRKKVFRLFDLAVDAGANGAECMCGNDIETRHAYPTRYTCHFTYCGVHQSETKLSDSSKAFGPDAVEMTYDEAWDYLQGLINEQRKNTDPSEKEPSKSDVSTGGTGMKFDGEKPMYNLLPANAIDMMAQVLTFGAQKYAPNSWQTVPDGLERYRAALLRHAFAIQRGEVNDSETGLPHASHIMCCAAFIAELQTENE